MEMSFRWLLTCLIGLAVMGLVAAPSVNAQPSKTANSVSALVSQRADLYARFFKKLDELIVWAEKKELADAVAELKRWQTPVDGQQLLTKRLPRLKQAAVPRDLGDNERDWRIALKVAREEHAKELYLLSRRIVNADQPSLAYAVLREVLHFDPDHERGRALLGFVQYGEEWMTPFAAKMAKKNMVWHEKFGWLPEASVKRYEDGERFYLAKWMTAEREESQRMDFRNAWEIETEHYRVLTNVGLERGVELSRKLEVFHDYFHNSFAAFFESPEQLKKLFNGSPTKGAKVVKPFEVHFFRTKDEYVNKLKKHNPQIGITNGIFMPDDHKAYFFESSEADVESTLYHEATHQLLFELSPSVRASSERPWDREHFWIIEGFACYMESFRQTDDGVTIGDPKYIRFDAAHYRLIHDNYYVPLARFASMGKVVFQGDDNIEKNYSQASGLAHFFLHYDGGRYRDALVRHIELLYAPTSTKQRGVPGLDQLTGTPYEQLDAQYREHITSFSTRKARTDE